MVRTTIVLPEPLHEELRLEAFNKRLSMATIIRMRLERSAAPGAAAGDLDPILAIAGLAPAASEELLTAHLDDDLYGDNS